MDIKMSKKDMVALIEKGVREGFLVLDSSGKAAFHDKLEVVLDDNDVVVPIDEVGEEENPYPAKEVVKWEHRVDPLRDPPVRMDEEK